jgi:GR25 family glycosyltransferase involved in LPS biosynthesis
MNSEIIDNIHVRYINLDRRVDRLEQMKQHLNFLQFKPENIKRFSAINGNDIINDLKNKNILSERIFNIISNKQSTYYSGEIACTLSHYFLLKEIINDNSINDDDIVFIFEDDIFMNTSYLDTNPFTNVLKELNEFTKTNSDWDLIYMGGRFKPGFTESNNTTCFLKKTDHFYKRLMGEGFIWDRTNHNLIINKKSALKIYNETYNAIQTKYREIDHIYANLSISSYDYFPHIFYSPQNYTTDIQGSNKKNIIDKRYFLPFISDK